MKLIESKKFVLPVVYLIWEREKIEDLPLGVPFIYGDRQNYSNFVMLLEREFLYKAAKATGYPFDFVAILEDAGYKSLEKFSYWLPEYTEIHDVDENDTDIDYNIDNVQTGIFTSGEASFKEYINDTAVYVDMQVLKDLKIIPVWLPDLKTALEVNIHSAVTFNPYMYNKKLDGMYGGVDFTPQKKNLYIVDMSFSIPKGCSSTSLLICKDLAESNYADILLTGATSKLIPYEEIHKIELDTIYEEIGMGQECLQFRKLLTTESREYGTVVCYGDNHSVSDNWGGAKPISDETGKKECLWKVEKIISLHTDCDDTLAGYARWFDVEEENITYVKDWVKYMAN